LGGDGLRLELGYSRVNYELGDEFEVLEASGWADTFEATFSYPLIRSASRNLYLSLGVAHKRTEDEYRALDYSERSDSTLGRLSIRHEAWGSLFGRPLYARIGAGLVFGSFRIPDDQKWYSRGTEGGFSYATLDFLASLSLTEKLSLSLSASGQQALGSNLDSSEQFNVTGLNGVKAYREAISGDNGYLLGAELQYRLPGLPERSFEHYLGLFADLGGWSLEKGPFPEKRSDTLSDVGLSYTAVFGPVGLKARLVRGLGRYPEELKRESRTYASALLTVSF
jgi:hemolysin activation/secretion protein